MKKQVKISVTKEQTGYSATTMIKNNFIATEAETFEDLKKNVLEAVNFTFEEKDLVFTMQDFKFEYDIKSFFDFYSIIKIAPLSKRIKINPTLLSQYINGIKKPSAKQKERIIRGVHQIGKELSESELILN